MASPHANAIDMAMIDINQNEHEHSKFLWFTYCLSTVDGEPQVVLSKDIGDRVGVAGLERMANTYCLFMEEDVMVALESGKDAYLIATLKGLFGNIGRIVLSVNYKALTAVPRANLAGLPAAGAELVKVAKTPNCFILYRQEKQVALRAENPGMQCKDISVTIGEMWAHESAEVKAHYKSLADQAKDESKSHQMGQASGSRRSAKIKRRSNGARRYLSGNGHNGNIGSMTYGNNNVDQQSVQLAVQGQQYFALDYQPSYVDAWDPEFANTLPLLDPAIEASLDFDVMYGYEY